MELVAIGIKQLGAVPIAGPAEDPDLRHPVLLLDQEIEGVAQSLTALRQETPFLLRVMRIDRIEIIPELRLGGAGGHVRRHALRERRLGTRRERHEKNHWNQRY